MRPPTRGAVRLLRAGATAGAVLGLAVGAHTAAGGGTPPAGAVGFAALALTLVCVLVTRRQLGTPTVVVLLGAGQVVLHRVFGAVSAVECTASAAPAAALHHGGATAAVVCGDGSMTMTHGPAPTVMLAAHVAATALCALLLLLGERAVFALWCWLAPLVALRVAVLVLVSAPGRRPRRAAVRLPRGAVLRVAPRRGPPAPHRALQLAA